MADLKYVKATPELCDYIAAHLKEEDFREIVGASGVSPRKEIDFCVRCSEWSMIALIDDVPVAVFGIRPVDPINRIGVVFLLTTGETLNHKMITGRETKRAMRFFLKDWNMLYNYCDGGNVLVLRWLKFLGAKIYPAGPYGLFGRMYHRFEFTPEGIAKRYKKEK